MNSSSALSVLRDKQRNYERQRKIKIDIMKTQFPLIRNIAVGQIGWTIWGKQDQKGDANLFWIDTYLTEETVKRLNPYQRINHFPNSQELGKKNLLCENLKKIQQMIPDKYDFFPQTWVLPDHIEELKASHAQSKKWYIIKPASSSQGKGIYLTKQIGSIPRQSSVVQQYITNPCLIDGCKFDLRIYVLIKSLNPLKVFRYVEGLTRLAIHSYQKPCKANKKNLTIHLTNYAINKLHPDYIQNKSIQEDYIGHKRSLNSAYNFLQGLGCDKNRLQSEIDEIIIKTILAAYSKLLNSYKNCRDHQMQNQSVCFQILGFDILIDENFKPWLLEVNHSPSFSTDSPLDFMIKRCLILDSLVLLNLKGGDKQIFLKNRIKETQPRDRQCKDISRIKQIEENNYQKIHLGGYQKIYPQNKTLYSEILKKINEKGSKKKKAHIPPSENLETHQTQQLQIFKIRKKKPQIISFYGSFSSQEQLQQNSKNQKIKEEDALRRHLFLQRERKKIIEPIKMNNVNISFKQEGKKLYMNGFYTNRSIQNNRSQENQLNMTCRTNYSESKTSEGFRKQINLIDTEIKSRIGKMKMARLKLQRIKNTEKKGVDSLSPNKIISSINTLKRKQHKDRQEYSDSFL